ncbi:peptidoglycan DD-metalloendopeptidase family protein [Cyanobacteria bacterium FACHB-63]|nr:peptidoglycan DD-metalloendopeptidase family protein [Cyanobacteria bacterium FACHB-63]
MIELIPALLAQQPLKQTATPTQPIEPSSLIQSQSATPTVTPDSPIAIPESVFVPVKATPTPSPTAKPASQAAPVTSKVALPKVPQARTSRTTARSAPPSNPQPLNSQTASKNEPVAPKVSSTAPTKPTEKPAPSIASPSITVETPAPTEQAKSRVSSSIEIPVPKPTNQVEPEASGSRASSNIEIPVPKPANQIAPEASRSEISDRIKVPAPKPTNQVAPATSRSRASSSIEIPVPKPANQIAPEASRSRVSSDIEIPAPKPANQVAPETSRSETSDRIEVPTPKPAAQTAPQSSTQAQKQLLEQRLADIVSRDRSIKQAAQRDTLVARAYSYATQRRFEQARKLLQDPAIPAEVRGQIASNINSLESASRTIGVTPIKAPTVKRNNAVLVSKRNNAVLVRKSSMVSRSVSIPVPRPQQAISIQIPRAIDSLPIQQRPPATDLTAPIASDAGSESQYSGQVVNPKNLQAFNRNLPRLNSTSQIVYPLPEPVPVTSRFGWRRHPVTGVRRFHAGVDLGAGQGTPVIASRGGKVKIADRMGGYGLAIVLQQPNGAQDTLYAHLSQIFVRPGETIQPGAIIGRVGSTGLSTGPHLHYEARRKTNSGWVAVDPGGQLEAARVRLVQARRIEAQSSSNQGG